MVKGSTEGEGHSHQAGSSGPPPKGGRAWVEFEGSLGANQMNQRRMGRRIWEVRTTCRRLPRRDFQEIPMWFVVGNTGVNCEGIMESLARRHPPIILWRRPWLRTLQGAMEGFKLGPVKVRFAFLKFYMYMDQGNYGNDPVNKWWSHENRWS